MYLSNSCIKHFFFSFPSDLFIYQLYFFVFWPVWTFNFLLLSILFWNFCFFFIFFRMLWMLVTVNKAKFSPRKKLVTIVKSQHVPCIRLSLHHVKTFRCSFVYPLTFAIIIFSEAHGMSCFHTRNFKLQ